MEEKMMTFNDYWKKRKTELIKELARKHPVMTT